MKGFVLRLLVLLLVAGGLLAQDRPRPADAKPAEAKPGEKPKPEAKPKPKKPGEGMLAVVGGRIDTVSHGTIRRGTVLVDAEGKIAEVGEGVAVPEGATVIDAAGRLVTPGLVAPLSFRIGIAGPAGGSNLFADALDPWSLSMEFALSAGITTVFARAGGGIGMSSAAYKLSYGDLDGMMIREPVALSLSYNGPAERFLVREALTQARAYLSELAEYEKAKAAGKKVNPPGRSVRPEYVELAKGVLPARLQVTKADDILAALLLVDDFGIRLVLEDAPEAWIVAEEIARRNVPVLITPRRFPDPDPMLDRQNGGTIECARILEEKGVRFAVLPPGGFGGPGYGISMMGIAGRDLMTYPMAAAFAVRGGASRRAAFRAITIVAAEISGVAERVGTIEVKKDGDLVIWDGDPLSIRGFADIVIVGGKVAYDRKKADLFGPRAKFDGR